MKIDIEKTDVIIRFEKLLDEWGGKYPDDDGVIGASIKQLQSAREALTQTSGQLDSEISKLTERKEALESLKPVITIPDDVPMVGAEAAQAQPE